MWTLRNGHGKTQREADEEEQRSREREEERPSHSHCGRLRHGPAYSQMDSLLPLAWLVCLGFPWEALVLMNRVLLPASVWAG